MHPIIYYACIDDHAMLLTSFEYVRLHAINFNVTALLEIIVMYHTYQHIASYSMLCMPYMY